MIFKIEKRANGSFWHYLNDVRISNISDFDCVYDQTYQTFIIQCKNGSNVPKNSVKINDVILNVSGVNEFFADVYTLEARLRAINYTPYASSGSGGGAVNSVNGLDGDVVLNGSNILATNPSTLAQEPIDDILEALGGNVIVKGYFNGTNFYTDALYTTLITPDATKLYISKNGNLSYRYEGGSYKKLGERVIHEFNNPSTTAFTGTTTETEIYKFLIPANTLSSLDTLDLIKLIYISNIGVSGNDSVKIRTTTSGSFSVSAKLMSTFVAVALSSSVQRASFIRSYDVLGGNVFSFFSAAGQTTDFGQATMTSVVFDPTVDNWIHISVALANAGNSGYLRSIKFK